MVTAVQVKNTICAIKNVAQSVVPAVSRTAAAKPAAALPEFLYHFTSKSTCEKILSSGKIRIFSFGERADLGGLPGIYMVDKENFFAQWLSKNDIEGLSFGGLRDPKFSLAEHVLSAINSRDWCSGISSIKIPTVKLDKSKLRFRPCFTCEKEVLELQKKCLSTADMPRVFKGTIMSEGLDLSDLPKYIAKEPVEYVYTQEIPASLIADIKTAEIKEMSINKEQVLSLFA